MKHLTSSDILFIHQFAKDNNLHAHINLNLYGDIYFITYDANSIHAGMQILYNEGLYEVSQYQAGKKANELHIYTVTKSLKIALKSLLKGNKGRKIIELYR
jgi:hypothetical protein